MTQAWKEWLLGAACPLAMLCCSEAALGDADGRSSDMLDRLLCVGGLVATESIGDCGAGWLEVEAGASAAVSSISFS